MRDRQHPPVWKHPPVWMRRGSESLGSHEGRRKGEEACDHGVLQTGKTNIPDQKLCWLDRPLQQFETLYPISEGGNPFLTKRLLLSVDCLDGVRNSASTLFHSIQSSGTLFDGEEGWMD